MTEQQPNGGEPTPAEPPVPEAPDAEKSAAAERPTAAKRPAAEQPAAAGERPARHGPPVEVAEEVLDERGKETAEMLGKVLGSLIIESGGREDIPWARVDAADLYEAAQRCRDRDLQMDMLHLQLAVDWVERIQMVYVLHSVPLNRKVILKADLPPESPVIDSVTDLWEAAGWYERETHDLFGVEFAGNPDMSPLLLFEGFEGFPGRKSYPLHEYEEW
jgi:NADH:ubiquinone oxidoreductase subunit C